jgi:hypothetical protein
MKTSEHINELATALASAQGEIENAVADAENPAFRSTYADLASVRAAIKAPLSKNGLAIIQIPTTLDGKTALTSRMLHKSGQWIEDTCVLLVEKPTMQGMGSAITYMKRYALAAMTGLAEDDDDGNEATKHPAKDGGRAPRTDKGPVADGRSTASKETKKVSEAQARRLYGIIKDRMDAGWDPELAEQMAIKAFGVKEAFTELTMAQYDKLVGWVQTLRYEEAYDKLTAWLADKNNATKEKTK